MAEWEEKATVVKNKLVMAVDTAKHAVEVAEEAKNKAEVAEVEAKNTVAAMREAEATEAVEAATLASSAAKQAGEAAKQAAVAAKQMVDGKKPAKQTTEAAKQAAVAAERAAEAANQAADYKQENQGSIIDSAVIQESPVYVDGETQVCPTQKNEEATQTVTQMPALVPICYGVPVKSRIKSDSFCNDDEGIKYYTGLLSWAVFKHFISFLSDCNPTLHVSSATKLSSADGVLLTLMRLRLNLRFEDLSFRFGVSSVIFFINGLT